MKTAESSPSLGTAEGVPRRATAEQQRLKDSLEIRRLSTEEAELVRPIGRRSHLHSIDPTRGHKKLRQLKKDGRGDIEVLAEPPYVIFRQFPFAAQYLRHHARRLEDAVINQMFLLEPAFRH